jgi:hypothetical protein
VNLKDLRNRANLKLAWIQWEQSFQVWLITKLGVVSWKKSNTLWWDLQG